jgi:methionine-R-sulfoxide reductase
MKMVRIIGTFFAGFALASLWACTPLPLQEGWMPKGFLTESPKRDDKVVKTDEEWKRQLTPEQYKILRSQGTEAPFCSPMNDVKDKGKFYCVGCDLELFTTDNKFNSGTGWPSFFQPASKDAIWIRPDYSHGMNRVEVLCSRCDGHLGHVFQDGPKPTGLRFCINGEVLKFVKSKE